MDTINYPRTHSASELDMSDDGDSKVIFIVTRIGALIFLSLAFLLLRIFSKLRYRKPLDWDDYLLAFAWTLLATATALIYVSCTHGLGQHRWALSLEHAAQALKHLVIQMQLALTAGCLGQISIAVTLFSIVVTKVQKTILWGVIGSVIITKVLSMALVFTRCEPIERLWMGGLVEGSCEDFGSLVRFWMFSALWSATVDLVLVAIPVYVLWGLQMEKVKKIGLCVAFTAGIFSAVTAICEASYLPRGDYLGDVTYHAIDNLIWTFSEPAVIIMAASVPFLHKLAEEIAEKVQKLAKRCSSRHRDESSEPVPLTGVQTDSAEVSQEKSKMTNQIVTPYMGSGIVKTSEIFIETHDRGEQNTLTFQEAIWESAVVSTPLGTSRRWSVAGRE